MPVSGSPVMFAECALPNCAGMSAIGLPASVEVSLSRWQPAQSICTVCRPLATRSGVTSTLRSIFPGG